MDTNFSLPEKNTTTNHAYAYLNKTRHIDRDVISKFITNKNMYEDNRYNCVFVGYDYDSKAKFCTLQGTNTTKIFRADVKGSNNEIGLFLNNNSETLVVSDTVIDGMSLMSIMKSKGKNIDDYSYLMLSGTNKSFEAIRYHLSHNKDIKNIVISFSNDTLGKKAVDSIKSKLKEIGFEGNVIEYYPKYKSFNEDLIYRNTFLNEMRERNERARTDNAGTSRGYGRTGEPDKGNGEEPSGNGQIRTGDIETYSANRQESIHPTAIVREPIREDIRKRESSTNETENSDRATGETRENRRNRGLHGEGINSSEDTDRSRQSRDAGDSLKTDVKNFKAESNVSYGGGKTKFQNNVAAIRLLKEIEQQGRLASPVEQTVLSKYTGWGGISQAFDENNQQWNKEYLELKSLLTEKEYEMARASTPNAHYTDPVIINAMYTGLNKFGFKEGKILEPAMGIGNFFAQLPDSMENSKLYGVELDDLSGRISKQLFPNADIQIRGFEKTEYPDNYFDVAIGNIPFGNYEVNDSKYNKHKFLIHDYFFAKTLDKVKPNGIIAFVTSKGTLDKANASTRRYLAEKAELLGAVRLPNTAFRGIANTEVTTDIIFLRKREKEIVCEPNWVHLGLTEDNVPVNQYFLDNPNMMLGKMIFDSSMYGNEKLTALVNEDENFNLESSLNKAIDSINAEVIEPNKTSYESNAIEEILADPNVKNFTYTLINSDLYYRENSVMVRCELTGQKLEKAKHLHQIRNSLRTVIDIQTNYNYSDFELQKAQNELNKLYDDFVVKYGYINHKNNQSVFEDDIDNPLILSIEKKTGENEYEKADIFKKATIKPKENFKIETAYDALIVSLNQQGKVNIPYMANIYNKSQEEVIKELGDKIFLNPENYNPNRPYEGYETAEEYLSGDVKAKLAYAENSNNEIFKSNIDALRQVQPENLKIYDIGYKLGSNWIPLDMYHEFMYETLQTPSYYRIKDDRESINIVYNEFNTAYTIYNKNNDSRNVLANSKFGTPRRNAYQIIEDTLNFKASNVYDLTTDENGKEKRVLNSKETQVARAKQELLKNEFVNWVLKKEERISKIESIYNERFNVYVPRKYDGNNLIVPSMSENLKLRKHQKDTAMRILLGGNTLIAHEVGAGKTFTMATGAVLLKQAGIAKKPLFVVPNHLIKQWGAEFLSLYPTANVLVPSEKDFEMKNRQKFISKIATGDYDAVILSFSQFEKIPMSPEYIEGQIKKEINEISDAIKMIKQQKGERALSVKQYEMQKKTLETRLSKMNNEGKKDKVLNFEQLGVDYLFVDEAHNYKNCFVHTKMNNVAGVSTTNAQKSFDILLKTRYLTEKNNGRGIIFATGTPVTNSISETYVMQRYLQEATLKKSNINHFDQWASVFGEITTSLELAPTGTSYRMKTRFSKFYNMPELLKMFNQCADMKSVDDLDIKRPDIAGGKAETIVVKPSGYVLDKMKELEARCDLIKDGRVDATIDNMLKITMEGKGVAIDPTLVDPDAPVNKDSKIYACCNKVVEMYNEHKQDKALQLVFLDYGIQLYDVMKKELIEKGVNEKEIAFISDAKNDKQKEALFEKCRNGKIRVLFGSTAKMGAGTNVQDRMIALHHIDCPWRPADIEQRNGRIRRQGNKYDKVHIFQYVTEGTFDSYLWQIQEKKQIFISQIMKNDTSVRNYEDLDQAALECSEVKALCCGDPRIKEKADIDNDIQRLQIEKNAYLREQENLKSLLKNIPHQMNLNARNISNLEKDLKQLQVSNENFEIILQGKVFVERADAAEGLQEHINNIQFGKPEKIGSYKGLDLIVSNEGFSKKLTLAGSYKYDVELGSSGLGNITRIENIQSKYSSQLDRLINYKRELEKQLTNASEELGKPFIKESELERKLQKQAQLAFELELGKTVDVIIDDSTNESKEIGKGVEKESIPIMGNIKTNEGIAGRIAAAKQKASEQILNKAARSEPTI